MTLPAARPRSSPVSVDSVTVSALTLAVNRLIESLAQPILKPEITVPTEVRISPTFAQPAVNVAAPPPAQVFVDVAAPDVRVEAPQISMAPQVSVVWAPKSSKTRVVRDGNGNITETITEYQY